MTEMNIRTNW